MLRPAYTVPLFTRLVLLSKQDSPMLGGLLGAAFATEEKNNERIDSKARVHNRYF